MSWKTINTILGLAATDEGFCQELLEQPVRAIAARNFEMTEEEQKKLAGIAATDLAGFSQQVLILFREEEE